MSTILITHRKMQEVRAFGPATEPRLLRILEQKQSEDETKELRGIVVELQALPPEVREGIAIKTKEVTA